jgi:hypothetical protein
MSRKLVYGKQEFNAADPLFQLRDETGEYQDLWISADMYYHPIGIPTNYMSSHLPRELIKLIAKWHEIVKTQMPEGWAGWIEKGASLKFVYKDEFYILMPYVIDSTPEFFMSLTHVMKKDLKALGSSFMQYTGMID